MKNIIYEFSNPNNYEFKHPCGIIKKEEQFFYDPYKPKPRIIIIDDLEGCAGCPSFFPHKDRNMCQGLEIELAKKQKIPYTIRKRA